MSNKYNHSDHIAILSEILTLQDILNETQTKVLVAKQKLDKMDKLKEEYDEIPF